ncbi:MAG: hypothetical protein AAGG09_20390 [Pseudomonadota bacterium]
MRAVAVLSLLALIACDSPDPLSEFAGVPPMRVDIAGSIYSVRVAGSRAQAIRQSVEFGALRSPADYVARSGLAMEQASGCRVVSGSLTGDAAMSEARLAC